MANIQQFYGIKFPFTINNTYNYFIDMNPNIDEKVSSEIAHFILTPKRTRIRRPDFGTDLIKFIFEMNDPETWDSIKDEICKGVSRWVPSASINDINVYRDEANDNAVYVDINYDVFVNGRKENNRMVLKL